MQPTQRRILFILILIIGAAWILLSADAAGHPASQGSAPQVGFMAPDFTLNTLQGYPITLSGLRGQAVLINLWATWCPPCRAEMPVIESLYREYREAGLVVLGINVTYQDDPFAIPPFVEEYDLTFPILLDETGLVSNAYQLRSLPSSYFIGRDGIIAEVVIGGPMSEALLRTRLEQILN